MLQKAGKSIDRVCEQCTSESKSRLPNPQFYDVPFILLDVLESVLPNVTQRFVSKVFYSLRVRRIRLIYFMLKHCIPRNILLVFNF